MIEMAVAGDPIGLTGAERPRSLYVHVPFCARRCHYCDFAVVRSSRPPTDEWLSAIQEDLRQWFASTAWSGPVALDTIFVGGGTPSLIGARGMHGLARLLRRWFVWDPRDVEWTAESNPSSLASDVCAGWREAGVNRLSIGVQSFDDRVLAWLGRLHDARQALAALDRAREAGFDNVNLDLIFGLPAEIERDWEGEVTAAVRQDVTHVSVYGLAVEPRTRLARRIELGLVRPPDDERYAEEYLDAAAVLTGAGFVHYEVSNFARPGLECRHNWHYWDGTPYLGVGPSSHSYVGGRRVWNVYDWEAYRKAVIENRPLREDTERTTTQEELLERVWLRLRTRAGVELDGTSGGSLIARCPDLAAWEAAGWVVRSERRLRLTPAGWLRLDELVAALGVWLDKTDSGRGTRADGTNG